MRPDLRFTLDSYLRQLTFLEGEKSLLEKDLQEHVLPKGDVLQSVPGVGPITSSLFRAELFDPNRFEKAEQVASYVGLAPVISQSGASNGYARLIPCGQCKLRSVLVEAAWRLMSKEEWASAFYSRIMQTSFSASHLPVRSPRVSAISPHVSATSTPWDSGSIGLHFVWQARPSHKCLIMSFLFVRPRVCLRLTSDSASRRTPLPSANSSYCQACRGLSPPSYRTCRAH
jgi:hypothetical protein